MTPSGIRDDSTDFWQCYGIRARIKAENIRECVEKLRAIAGTIRVNHPITIVSPSQKVWRIAPGKDIEVRNLDSRGN